LPDPELDMIAALQAQIEQLASRIESLELARRDADPGAAPRSPAANGTCRAIPRLPGDVSTDPTGESR
jgi:hypothetical protein